MNRGCGNLLLKAAEEHSHRCLAADLFPTRMGMKTFKCWATATWNNIKSWCSYFFGSSPPHKRSTLQRRSLKFVKNEELIPYKFGGMIEGCVSHFTFWFSDPASRYNILQPTVHPIFAFIHRQRGHVLRTRMEMQPNIPQCPPGECNSAAQKGVWRLPFGHVLKGF